VRRIAAALAVLWSVACDRGGSSQSSPPASSAADTVVAPAATVGTRAGEEDGHGHVESDAATVDEFAQARPIKGKSIGHTSVVFKVGFEGGLEAAFKPRSRRGKDRYKGEVAAYRLARALGLSNVPRAIPRTFELKRLKEAFAATPAAVELLDKEAVADPDGTLRGALIPWIPKLEFVPLENAEWRARWQAWLKTGAMSESDRSLAAQISTMIVFDWLTANWDRWSGANIGIDRATNTLLYVDNDGAFFDPVPPKLLGEQLALLKKVERFSPRFIGALDKLDPPALAAAMGDESPGVPLLSEPVLHAIDERRRIALEHMVKMAARADAGSGFD
jgi:hypothetical protein